MRMPHQHLLLSNNELFFRLQTFPWCVSFGVGWGWGKLIRKVAEWTGSSGFQLCANL